MAEATLNEIHKDIEELKRDVAVLKDALLDEGELSDWAKERIAQARKTPDSEFISHEALKKELM